ncbi:MAG: hypothetical protein AB8G14_08465 [Ilumatobacter sp.]
MAPSSRISTRWSRASMFAVIAAVGLTGCFTGERPSFEDDDTAPAASTGNVEIDKVLGLLDSVDRSEFTVGYDITTNLNNIESTGLVVQAEGRRRSVTIENSERSVRFIQDAGEELTCDLLIGACEPSLLDARISDTQLPHTFYGPAFANRLRADADRRISDPTAYTKNIAGQEAQCVDLDVSGGTKTYCALPAGPLAQFVGADVSIDLTSYSPRPDESKFETS